MTEVARDVLVRKWARELAEHTGRSVADIEARGLSAGHFDLHGIKISYEDGSTVAFRWSFLVRSAETPNLVAVFTEHCGYHEFILGPEDVAETCQPTSPAPEEGLARSESKSASLKGRFVDDNWRGRRK